MKRKLLGLGIILAMISMCGCGADEGGASESSAVMDDEEISAEIEAEEEGSEEGNETYKTPKDYIFSGTEEDYLTYIYVKDTEVITASRYYFMGESTDLVDITFMSYAEDYLDDGIGDLIYGGDAGDRELAVKRSGFNEDSCSVSVSDEEYDNLNEPIIVTFSNDMSSIDVTATWKAGVLNQQAIFNGHYELQGTYTVDEMSGFWIDGRRNFENIIGTAGTEAAETQESEGVNIPSGVKADDSLINPDMLSGLYGGTMGQSTISLSIYSSQEEGETGIGNAEIYVEGGQYSYNGQIAGVAINVYEVMADTGEEVLLAASASDDGVIMLQLYVDGQLIEEYLMLEHYES